MQNQGHYYVFHGVFVPIATSHFAGTWGGLDSRLAIVSFQHEHLSYIQNSPNGNHDIANTFLKGDPGHH